MTKIILFTLLFILAMVVTFAIVSYNGLVKLKVQIEEAFATMDVYLKQRFDLVPNLVETVKGYSAHEAETLSQVVQMRQGYQNLSVEQKIQQNVAVDKAMPNFNALMEAYPELKANENYMNLMNQLQDIENNIANSRKYYNGCVRLFNVKVQVFPSNIIANMFHFEKQPMFEVSDEKERENVQVKF